MADTDMELLDRWRAGDTRAAGELFHRHFQSVYRFVSNKLDEEVEDLVQQAFLACLKGRDRFRKESSFRTYLFAAARNLVYLHWRQRSRRPQVDFSVACAQDLGPSPSSVLGHKADERLLLEALRQIPVENQIALELYHIEGLRSREIAEILDIPHGTVRSRLRRGLAQVRERLEALATSPQALATTLTRLEDWAAALHE